MAARKAASAFASRVLNRVVTRTLSSPLLLHGRRGRREYGAVATAAHELETPVDPPFPVQYTKLLINGEFVDSASCKTFPTIDPRSGKVGYSD
jgi:aldehyde dehydrogenase (NAD+)